MPSPTPRLRHSVFAKLVAIMVTLAVSLLIIVGLFFWLVVTRNVHDQISISTAHEGMLILLPVMILATVLTAHIFLRHLLGPLQVLSDGVARLGEGALDVRVVVDSRDEFGLLTDAFNEMVGRVREMIGARDELLVNVSHELRSPLTRMKVSLELLPPGEHRARLATDVVEMERMVTELLELERLRAGRGLRTERADLAAIVAEVAEAYRNEPPGVVVRSVAGEVAVDLDAEKVRTVLRNLLENAGKYSLPDSGPIEVVLSERGRTVEVRVMDDGAGVSPVDAELLFEPFYRVDRSRSKRTGGYGLGLSICRSVMQAHGGTIQVEPRVGRGASFVLSFPLASGVMGSVSWGQCRHSDDTDPTTPTP